MLGHPREEKLAAIWIDGIHIDEHVVLVADTQEYKQVLGRGEGPTKNATACTALLADMQGRGMRTDRTTLVGSESLLSQCVQLSARDDRNRSKLLSRLA